MGADLIGSWLKDYYSEVEPMEFYRELFPKSELDTRDSFTKGRYTGIAIQISKDSKVKRFTICDDLFPIKKLISTDDFIIISPVSYAGKSQKQSNARFLYAVTFDLDGIIIKDGKPQGLIDLFHQIGNGFLPKPTYTISSGNGLHLYYFLERPIPLFKNVLEQLAKLRVYLTKQLWNRYVTNLHDNIQYESVTQSFRAVGCVTKDKQKRVRAFLTGERVTLEYLNAFCKDESSKVKEFAYKSNLTLAEAKELYPEWYKERIIDGRPKTVWTIKSDLYSWFLNKIKNQGAVGHRYFCIMALAAYAIKCNIPRNQLEHDALSLIPFLDSLSIDESNRFTVDDVMKALEAFNLNYVTFPRDTIERLTAIEMPPNKRNFQNQMTHLQGEYWYIDGKKKANICKLNREIALEEARLEGRVGRKDKKELVKTYFSENPKSTVREASKALGISATTVQKWKNS